MHEPDPGVVSAARRGDVEAFTQLVRMYQADVWRFCISLLRDPVLAEDVTQEAFLKAFRFMHHYKARSRFSTWLFSVARNCALDELRRSGRRERITAKLGIERAQTAGDIGTAFDVRAAVLELPLDIREPLLLIDMFGLPYREVAKMMGIPEGTIKSRVHRARELLSGALAEADDEATDG